MTDTKTSALAQVFLRYQQRVPKNVLVVGCGSGQEARILAEILQANVIGIDTRDNFAPEHALMADLRVGDATNLAFPDNQFDFVYSYHALEHIPNYKTALREMGRVLIPDGAWCIGTPNRARLIGYLGSKTASLAQKISWNIADWRMRLRGRFRNEYGAHAGFTSNELQAHLEDAFGDSREVTMDYYRVVYPRRLRELSALASLGLASSFLPSIYFLGTNANKNG